MTNSDEQKTSEEEISQYNQVEQSNQEKNISDTREKHLSKVNQQDESQEKPISNIDDRDKYITELEIKLEKIQQRERDNLLRAKAEIENTRKRSEINITKAHKFALERFISELLPVIDNLERALELSDKSDSKLSSMIEGIDLTLKSLLNLVNKFGLQVVNEVNIPFNPEIHQAMTIQETNEYEPNYVLMIIQKGYLLNNRLIRPAMVVVSKNKS